MIISYFWSFRRGFYKADSATRIVVDTTTIATITNITAKTIAAKTTAAATTATTRTTNTTATLRIHTSLSSNKN